MRVCNNCRKSLSVANIRKIQIVGENGRFVSKADELALQQIELCPECAEQLSNELWSRYMHND